MWKNKMELIEMLEDAVEQMESIDKNTFKGNYMEDKICEVFFMLGSKGIIECVDNKPNLNDIQREKAIREKIEKLKEIDIDINNIDFYKLTELKRFTIILEDLDAGLSYIQPTKFAIDNKLIQ